VLCGKIKRSSGKLSISGKVDEISKYKKISGFVPQENTMHEELTVRENILHSARIRLPRSWKDVDVQNHVDSILKILNLSHVAHTIIGDGVSRGVSGGQRKRVSIGMELAAAPLCLFLDEPTSGTAMII
jgi:ABC-type multidrug transport system ATPase subunit